MLALAELKLLIDALLDGGVQRYRDGSVELELHTHAGERGSVGAHNPDSSGATPEPATTPEQRHEAHLSLLLKSAGGVVPARLKRIPAVRSGE